MHTNADLRVILPCHAYRRCVRWHRLRVMRQNQVPVVAHPLIQNLVNRILLKTFLDYLFKGFKVSIFEEDIVASIATIQGVIDLASKARDMAFLQKTRNQNCQSLVIVAHFAK